MAQDLSGEQERRGTRNVMLWGCGIAAVLLIGGSLWAFLPGPEVGAPKGADRSTDHSITGMSSPTQKSAQSNVGRAQPSEPEDETGAKARNIQQSSQPLNLTPEQQQQIRSRLAKQNGPKVDKVDFELQIGTAVPRQQQLADLPADVAKALNGFDGSQYVIVRDRLVIVDAPSRRVVAIVPGVG
jgi:hypothetical protein